MLVNSEQRGLFKTLGLQARDLRRCMCETDVLNNPQRAAKEPHDVGEWAGVLIEHRIGAEQSLIPGSAPIKIGDRHGDMRNRGELSHHAPNSFGDPTLLGGSSFCWGTSTSATPGTIDSRFCDVYNAEAPGRVTAPESAGSVTGPRSISFCGWWRYRLTIRIRRSERPGLPRMSPAEPRRSRLFCTHTPGLGVHRRRLRTGLSHGLTAARLEPSVKTGCCRGPFRLAAEGARRRLSGVPYRAPMRESSPGRSYGTASRGRPLRPEMFPVRGSSYGTAGRPAALISGYQSPPVPG